jgi:hypothetical protein
MKKIQELQDKSQEKQFQEIYNISSVLDNFKELSAIIVDFCIANLAYEVDEKDTIKLIEAEVVELKNKYEEFKYKLKTNINLVGSFLRKIDSILIDNDFVNRVDREIYEATKYFDDMNKETTLQMDQIQAMYSAFIMLSRFLNTALDTYNKSHTENKLPLLHNISDPQTYEITDLNEFLKTFIKDVFENFGKL